MMKKILAMILTLTLCALALPALAEDNEADTVTALGTAAITLTPDMATFSVGVSTQDTQVATAQTANAAAMQQVIDAIKAQGVVDGDVQTDNYSINPVYDYQSGKFGDSQVLKGYTVSNTVTVTVHALDTLPALLDAAVAAGANQTYGITFQSSQSAAAYDQALTNATQEAVRKAKLIATALGRTAGGVISATEVNDSYVSYAASKSIAYDSATPIEVGTLSVSASVRVVLDVE